MPALTSFAKVFDLIPGWLYAIALVIALAGGVAENVRANKYKADLSASIASAEKARAEAQSNQRQIELERAEKVQEIAVHAQRQINAIEAQRDAAASAAYRLRNAATSAARRACPRTATSNPSTSESGQDPLDLLTNVLARHSSELVEVSNYADRLRVAGMACEQSYDSVRKIAEGR